MSKIYPAQNRISDPFTAIGSTISGNVNYWKWGDDNQFPYLLALLSRKSTTHRRIINDKADYISGKGFACASHTVLENFVNRANGFGESLRQLLNKLAFDKCLFGNAFLEVITDPKHSFLSLYHQDASRCRLSKDKAYILLHHNWSEFSLPKAKKLPLWPNMEPAEDGTLRSVVHYKDYEPMFENYGVPPYIAGLNVSAIAYKTDQWNISRLDNSFQLSGIMVLDGDVDNDEEARNIVDAAERKFAGKPGQVMFLVKNNDGTEGSKFIPVTSSNEGDWKDLHEQAISDIVVAHSWFRSLSGLDYSTGFNPDRVLREYEIALNTIIIGEQQELLEPICGILAQIRNIDTSSLQIINKPPISARPSYMMVWEARKMDGLEYDEADPAQRVFLARINTKNENDGSLGHK